MNASKAGLWICSGGTQAQLGETRERCAVSAGGRGARTALRMENLQEVDAAGTRWRGDPHEAEDGGGLVTDVGGNHAADKLGPAELSLWHHT